MLSGRSRPVATSFTCHVCQSAPDDCVAYAAKLPSCVGWNPARATVPSAASLFGSSSTRGVPCSPRRTYSTLWFCSPAFRDWNHQIPSWNGALSFS